MSNALTPIPQADAHACTLTVLTHNARTNKLAKTWNADGTVDNYDLAKQFHWREVQVASLTDVARLTKDLMGDPYSCRINGRLRDKFRDQQVVHRDLEYFEPQRTRVFMCDVDGYEPVLVDPLQDPAGAVAEFIEFELPEVFHNVSYIYKLSGSFGRKAGVLKVHLLFWLSEAYYPEELSAWVRLNKIPVDITVFRTVQVLYTANPVMADGVVDPIEKRANIVRKDRDELELLIPENLREQAAVHLESQIEVVDPTTKPGLIGVFCRTYTIEHVLSEFLDDQFTFDDDAGRRLTWHAGGGSAGGAFVSDCREYVGNTHNTDPLEGRLTNKWDLVRQYKFGHLDAGIDPFVLLNVATRPSQLAMTEWVKCLAEVQAELRGPYERLLNRVEDALDADELLGSVCDAVQSELDITVVQRERLSQRIKERHREVGAGQISITVIRQAVRPTRTSRGAGDGNNRPHWVDGIVYLRNQSCYYGVRAGEVWKPQDFNVEFNRLIDTSEGLSAHALVSNMGWVDVIHDSMYVPYLGARFTLDELDYVNAYKPASVPEAVNMGIDAAECVDAFKSHLLRLFSGRVQLRDHFIKWLANNVQHPGQKMPYAWLIKGCQGDGKTIIKSIITSAMGGANVGEASSTVLHTDYNGYAHGTAVCVLEEIRVSGKNRYDVIDRLKGPITNMRITIHRKGENEKTVINTTNYLAFSNHSDALPVDATDRRWAYVRSPYLNITELQAEVGDINTYFEPMHRLYREFGPHVRHWLMGVDLSDFDPAGRPPSTVEKEDLMELTQSDTDLVVSELTKDLKVINSRWLSAAYKNHPDSEPGGLPTKLLPKILEKRGYRKWYTQFKLDGKNITVYGLENTPWEREKIVEHLQATGQDKEPAISFDSL